MATPPTAPAPASGRRAWRWRHGLFERPLLVHPFAAALPALLSFTHDNAHMATWPMLLLPLGLTWAVSLPLLLLLATISRNPRTAAVVVSLVVGAFYAHPHAGAHATWMWGAVGIASVALLRYRGPGDVLTTFANLLVTLGVLPGLWTTWQDIHAAPTVAVRAGYLEAVDTTAAPPATGSQSDRPDIWYIVLDGFGREDVLADLYGIHRKDGLAAGLRERGFYVAEDAHSNYAQTALSFASALNMAPLEDLVDIRSERSRSRLALGDVIAHNRVSHALHAAGYHVVQYRGEYSVTRFADADDTRGAALVLDEYDYELFSEGTALPALTAALGTTQNRLLHAARRHAISTVLDDLPRGDRDPGPTFVYAHIVAPHPPFVFTPDGSYRTNRSPRIFSDGSSWKRMSKRKEDSYAAGYRDQARYVTRRILAAVDGILATSERPPVILIQGDHGPGSHLQWGSVTKTDMRERMSILSAYRVPDPSRLYPGITPMNSFRVVLDEVLGTSLPLLPDRSWFSSFPTPYVFTDVTDRLVTEEAAKAAARADSAKGTTGAPTTGAPTTGAPTTGAEDAPPEPAVDEAAEVRGIEGAAARAAERTDAAAKAAAAARAKAQK
jgi:hypothetical protein